MNLRKLLVAITAAVTLVATFAVPRAAFAWHDGPGSQGNRSADLALSATGPEKASEGSGFGVDYLIANDGPDSAGNAKLTIHFDSSKAAFNGGDRCTASGNTVTCSLGDANGVFSAGTRVTTHVSFRALTSGDTFVNTGTVSAQTKDPNNSNNTASVSVPLVLEYGCEGGVGAAASVNQPGVYWTGRSCRLWFSVVSDRNVKLELKPKPDFAGFLRAEIHSAGTTIAQISATFVAGQLVSGTPSTLVTLPAGDWILDVWPATTGTTVATPGYFLGGFCSRYPWYLCVPGYYVPPTSRSVYAPLAYGGYGALVTAA